MTDKKDLVDAYAFSRRRLVSAFLSGAPGGREVEPARPGRTLVAGVALAVLLLAGAAVAGVFHQQPDVDWSQPALISDESTGALYVNLGDVRGSDEPTLRAVVNVTSARLILGADATPQDVPSEEIAKRTKGPAVGIVDAPATTPGTGDLVNTGWTACTGRGLGTALSVSTEPGVDELPDAGLVVRSGRDLHLLATAPPTEDRPAAVHRYRIPTGASEELHSALGVAIRGDAIPVDPAWLQLVPEGGTLDASGLAIESAGEPLPATTAFAGYPRRARIGDYFTRDGRTYIITAEGPVVADAFALAVLRHATFDGRTPRRVPVDGGVALSFTTPPYAASRWPTELPQGHQQLANTQVCAALHTEPGSPPAVGVGVDPEPTAAAEGSGVEIRMSAGNGAVVRAADWSSATGGAPYLVDGRGVSHRLVDESAVDGLGYAHLDWVVVPDVWLELFEPGVGLSRDAALCPPATDGDAAPCG
jgi:type VII secretion protein EccB